MLGHRLLSGLQSRSYGAASAVAASNSSIPMISAQSFQMQRSPGGLIVASEDALGPVSRVMAVVRAGSRFESEGQHGVTHALRRSATLSTLNASRFLMEKTIQQIGANLSVTGNREFIVYTMEAMRDKLREATDMLGSIVTQPIFKSWEISTVPATLQLDRELAKQDPFFEVTEMLHEAAYRTQGMANRLLSNDELDGFLSGQLLEEYLSAHYTPERMALYGQGVGQEEMASLVQSFKPVSGGGVVSTATFKGGEVRKQSNTSPLSIALIAGEGASASSPSQYVLGVLEQLLGAGPSVKWGTGHGLLSSEVAKATDRNASAACFNSNYSDTGMFGVQLVGNPDSMKEAAAAAFRAVATAAGTVSPDALQGAKNRLKATLSFTAENFADGALARACTLLTSDAAADTTLESAFRAVDAVTSQQVQQAAKNLQTGKLAMAAVGNLGNTPYLDEIKR